MIKWKKKIIGQILPGGVSPEIGATESNLESETRSLPVRKWRTSFYDAYS